MTAAGLDTDERARCAVMSRWLATSSVLGVVAITVLVVDALGIMAHAWHQRLFGVAVLLLLSAPLERGLALRLHFDRGLFADLADGRIAGLAPLDGALATLGLRTSMAATRPLDDRLRGTMRLWRWHTAIVVVQVLLCAALLLGCL